MKPITHQLSDADLSRVIEMAWEDRTPFDIIKATYGLTEAQTIRLMRREMKNSTFKLWRARVSGRKTKHMARRNPQILRAYAPCQYKQR